MPTNTKDPLIATQVDQAQAFQIFTTADVTEGIDLEMLLKEFKEAACKGKSFAKPDKIQVLYNGRRLGNDERTLKQLGVKEGVKKLTVTNLGSIPPSNIGHALRSMGYAPTETQMAEFKEEVRTTPSGILTPATTSATGQRLQLHT